MLILAVRIYKSSWIVDLPLTNSSNPAAHLSQTAMEEKISNLRSQEVGSLRREPKMTDHRGSSKSTRQG